MLAFNYVHHGEARLVCEAHEQWGHGFQALHPPLPPLTLADVDATEGRPLVVRPRPALGAGPCMIGERMSSPPGHGVGPRVRMHAPVPAASPPGIPPSNPARLRVAPRRAALPRSPICLHLALGFPRLDEPPAGFVLQVGYVSPDLFTHSVSYFAEAPLAHHSGARVRHIVYSCVPKVGPA